MSKEKGNKTIFYCSIELYKNNNTIEIEWIMQGDARQK